METSLPTHGDKAGFLLQPRRQRSIDYELPFKTWGKMVALCEAGAADASSERGTSRERRRDHAQNSDRGASRDPCHDRGRGHHRHRRDRVSRGRGRFPGQPPRSPQGQGERTAPAPMANHFLCDICSVKELAGCVPRVQKTLLAITLRKDMMSAVGRSSYAGCPGIHDREQPDFIAPGVQAVGEITSSPRASTVSAELHHDARQQHRSGGRRGHVTGRRPGVKRPQPARMAKPMNTSGNAHILETVRKRKFRKFEQIKRVRAGRPHKRRSNRPAPWRCRRTNTAPVSSRHIRAASNPRSRSGNISG